MSTRYRLADQLLAASSSRAAATTLLASLLDRVPGRDGAVLLHGQRVVVLAGGVPVEDGDAALATDPVAVDHHELAEGWSVWTWPPCDELAVRSEDDHEAAVARVAVALHAELAGARAEAASLVRQQQQLALVLGVQQLLTRRASRTVVLDALVRGAMELLGSEAGSIHERMPDDPDHLTMVAAAGLARGWTREFARVHLERGLSGRVVREDRVLVTHAYDAEATARRGLVGLGITAVMGAPITVDGEPVAALVVSTRDPEHRYGPEDEELLTGFVAQASLAIQDARMVAERDAALHDVLTGLPGRRLFLDRLGNALERRDRDGDDVAVLFVDLDDFKPVNDVHGHAAGDRVLREVACRMAAVVRSGDTLARFGGDEFALVVHTADEPTLVTVADRLLGSLTAPFDLDGVAVHLGASIGIASSRSGLREPTQLLAAADAAMYRAKRADDGAVGWHEPDA